MPYGAKGGDTPAKDRKIERRVAQIAAKNPSMPKSEKIAIAKVQLGYGKSRTPHDHAQRAMKGRKR